MTSHIRHLISYKNSIIRECINLKIQQTTKKGGIAARLLSMVFIDNSSSVDSLHLC